MPTVKELKDFAKEQGINSYYKMRKAELIEALGMNTAAGVDVNQPSKTASLIDKPALDIKVPIFKPSHFNLLNLKSNYSRI